MRQVLSDRLRHLATSARFNIPSNTSFKSMGQYQVSDPGPEWFCSDQHISDQLQVHVIFPAAAWGRPRFFGRVLVVPLGLQPALRGDHLLGSVWRRTNEGFDVFVVQHFTLQQRIGQLEGEKSAGYD